MIGILDKDNGIIIETYNNLEELNQAMKIQRVAIKLSGGRITDKELDMTSVGWVNCLGYNIVKVK